MSGAQRSTAGTADAVRDPADMQDAMHGRALEEAQLLPGSGTGQDPTSLGVEHLLQ